jgi:hypothetical protein
METNTYEHTDQLTYFALSASILRLAHIPYPISPRNSPAGVANLLKMVGVKTVFVSSDKTMQRLLAAALEILETDLGCAPFSFPFLPV